MSQFDNKKAAALKYDGGNSAPVVVAAGSGYVAQKIIEVAQTNDVPVYQDNSLATLLAQLKVGSEIPPELYQAIVEIYVYFLKYVPEDKKVKTSYKEPPIETYMQNGKIKVEPDFEDVSSDNAIETQEEEKPAEPETVTLDQLSTEHQIEELHLDSWDE